jgi:hypothetical protein
MPTASTVPHFQPDVRPDLQTSWPWKGAMVPTILTGSGVLDLPLVVVEGSGFTEGAMSWMTAMSVPATDPSAAAEFPGPPNWLNPKLPRGDSGGNG